MESRNIKLVIKEDIMKKEKWNYAVVKSVFGDFWVGKTKLLPVKEKIFNNIQEAIQHAEELFMESHPDFDYDIYEDNDNDDELLMLFDEISEITSENAEAIKKGLEKFIY